MFGHFFLSSLIPLSLSLGDGPVWTEILSQRAVKPKTTNQPTYRDVLIQMSILAAGRMRQAIYCKRHVVIFFLLSFLPYVLCFPPLAFKLFVYYTIHCPFAMIIYTGVIPHYVMFTCILSEYSYCLSVC